MPSRTPGPSCVSPDRDRLRDHLLHMLDELDRDRAELSLLALAATGHGDVVDRCWDIIDQIRLDEYATRSQQISEQLWELSRPFVGGVVDIGSVVTIAVGHGAAETVVIGYRTDADLSSQTITPTSPLGRVLLGQRAGHSTHFTRPDGTRHDVQLLAVSP